MSSVFSDLMGYGCRTRYPQGKYLFLRGDVGNDFFIVEHGSVELSIFGLEGEKKILKELRRGEFFGVIEVFYRNVRPTNAYVEGGTQLISFTSHTVKDFIASHHDKAMQLISELCSTIDHGFEKIEDALVLNAYQQVSKLIYELGMSQQTRNLCINQRKISEILAISDRTTYTSFQKLREIGAIATRRSFVEILDYTILRQAFSNEERAAA